MASSSSARARNDGVGSPLAVRWFSVRDVENPMAPAAHGLGRQAAHGRRVVLRGILQAGGPLTHDVEAERPVGKLRAQVDVMWSLLDSVEVLGEALPRPLDALVEDGAGDVLHTLHERDQPVVRVEADTGAKPTPQLPITAVVTPCQLDGVMRESHVAWPS